MVQCSFSSKEGTGRTLKGQSRGRGLLLDSGCFIPSKAHCQWHLGNPKVLTLQGISLPLSRLLRTNSGPPTCSTRILNPVGCFYRPAPACTLWQGHWPPAVTSSPKRTETQSWGWGGASYKLLVPLRCTLSPSALEKVDLFTTSVVNHNEPFTS